MRRQAFRSKSRELLVVGGNSVTVAEFRQPCFRSGTYFIHKEGNAQPADLISIYYGGEVMQLRASWIRKCDGERVAVRVGAPLMQERATQPIDPLCLAGLSWDVFSQ